MIDSMAKPATSFARKAARLSWRLSIAAILLAMMAARLPLYARAVCEIIALGCAVAGIVSALIALLGICRHGSGGILWQSISGIVVSGLMIAIFVSNYAAARTRTTRNYESVFQSELAKMNAQLPKMIEPNVRLDEITMPSAKELGYRYTLMNAVKEDVDINSFVTTQKASLRKNYRTAQCFARFRKSGTRVRATYFDKSGQLIAAIAVGGAETPKKLPGVKAQ